MVCHIAYDEHRLVTRTDLLRNNGHEAVSVVGNEAEVVLRSSEHCDLSIVGDAAPEQTRKEMVDWLKATYPNVKILGLNAPDERELTGADYNVKLDGANESLIDGRCRTALIPEVAMLRNLLNDLPSR